MTEDTPSREPTIGASELSTALDRLGLGLYEERLRENGFDDWKTATAITESDMGELEFKLGDRRKLQRAIREHNATQSTLHVSMDCNYPLLFGGLTAVAKDSEIVPRSSQQTPRATRLYRRHPRPDPNASHKPKTAYMLFGEHVRQDPTLGRSSFSEIAKETGKRWKEISHEERVKNWETPAASRLQNYKKELERYKQTENYGSYQTYLEDFKQGQHNPESMISPNNRVSSTTEPVPPSGPPVSQDREELKATGQEHYGIEDIDLDGQSPDITSPIKSGLEEVRHISNALGVAPHLTRVAAFPQEDRTTKAVEAFLHGTGSLLYFWNREEALDLVKSVYHPDRDSTPVYATEVFAMSAVGSYCDGEAPSMLLQKEFLDFFLYMLSSPSDMSDFRRMRLFACLAICRFTNSVESARRLLCKRSAIFESVHDGLTARSFSP